MNSAAISFSWDLRRATGVALVVLAHAAALLALCSLASRPDSESPPEPLLVSIVAAAPSAPTLPLPGPAASRQRLPSPVPTVRPAVPAPVQAPITPAAAAVAVSTGKPEVVLASAGVSAPSAAAVTSGSTGTAAPQAPMVTGPIELSQLSVACTERPAPVYPPLSRRLNEEGTVILRVELQEDGSIASARVERDSGYVRLNEAALAAIRHWRCNAPLSNGRPVRAVARQPFNFVLGN